MEGAEQEAMARTGPNRSVGRAPGFGVYVHWPFCASKCPYCDFNSHVRAGGIDEARFLAAYQREIMHMAALSPGRPVSSIFFGGGTPSLMAPATVAVILETISRHWPLESGAEITIEANPSSVEASCFKGYRAAGINRVSLGVQSLHDAELKALGRLHSADEARAAIEIAAATFERFSFDLIYARPGQTVAAWSAELDEALALAGGHLSLYQLTIEDGTPFAALQRAGKLQVPEGGTAHDLYELTQEKLAAHGLPAYEISNHARGGEESRHNLLYWRYGAYAGIGAGAHGRLVIGGKRHAMATERNPERWLQLVEQHGHGVIERCPLSPGEQADEMLLMGLRLRQGLDVQAMAEMTGLAPKLATLLAMADEGLLELSHAPPAICGGSSSSSGGRNVQSICASRKGRFLLNRIILRLSQNLLAI